MNGAQYEQMPGKQRKWLPLLRGILSLELKRSKLEIYACVIINMIVSTKPLLTCTTSKSLKCLTG